MTQRGQPACAAGWSVYHGMPSQSEYQQASQRKGKRPFQASSKYALRKLTTFECSHLDNENVFERWPNGSRLLVVEAKQRVPKLEHHLLALDLLQQPPLKVSAGAEHKQRARSAPQLL
jgi:hypothetical protein